MKLTKTIDSKPSPSRMPALISLPHALVADGREFSYAPFLPGETLGAYIQRTGVKIAKGAVAAWHNGRRIPDHLWERIIPRQGDQIIVRGRAEGGGGGSKVLRTVALVAIAVVSYGVASGAIGAGTIGSISTATGISTGTLSAAAAAAISIGGSILVGAMIPEVRA